MPIISDCNVLVSGCFLILHPGHLSLFKFASQYSPNQKIHIAINGDDYIKKKYGSIPIPLIGRIELLQHIDLIERVHVFHEEEPSSIISKLRPKYYIRGPDYNNVALPEQEILDRLHTITVIHKEEKKADASKLVTFL